LEENQTQPGTLDEDIGLDNADQPDPDIDDLENTDSLLFTTCLI
jgi:hypothetical protein